MRTATTALPDRRWDVPEQFNFALDVVDVWARPENDKEALIWENAAGEVRRFRFSDFSLASNRLANALEALGICEGDRVLTIQPRVPEWQIAMLAILKMGAIAVPVPELLQAGDIRYRLTDSGAKAAFVHPTTIEKLEAVRRECPALETVISTGPCGEVGEGGAIDLAQIMAAQSDIYLARRRSSETPAVMYYSSGTTGYPKGILHAQRGLFCWRAQAESWLRLSCDDIILASTGTGWAFAGTAVLFGPWSMGACALMYDGPFDAARRLMLVARHRVTVYAAVPTELRMLLQHGLGEADLTSLRHIATGSETVTAALVERWRELTGIVPWESYGQSESLIVCANQPDFPVKIGSMGKPVPGYEVAIIDEEGNPAGTGEHGIIAVAADCPALFLGYWNKPEKTAAAFRNGWYLSGDLGFVDEEGYFWFVERADDVISSAGYRIGPGDVERVLVKHPAVAECAVVGSPDEIRGEVVKAFIVLREGAAAGDALAEDIQSFVKRDTAPYLYPRKVEFVDSLPRTDSGKVRRSELRRLERERHGGGD